MRVFCYRMNRWDFRFWYQKIESFMLLSNESMRFQNLVSKNGELHAFIDWIDEISECGIKNGELYAVTVSTDDISKCGTHKWSTSRWYQFTWLLFRMWYDQMKSTTLNGFAWGVRCQKIKPTHLLRYGFAWRPLRMKSVVRCYVTSVIPSHRFHLQF